MRCRYIIIYIFKRIAKQIFDFLHINTKFIVFKKFTDDSKCLERVSAMTTHCSSTYAINECISDYYMHNKVCI